MNRFKTTGWFGGLFCLLVAAGFAGGALGMTPAQMEFLSPFYVNGTHDLFKVEFTAISSTEVDVEGFEWDTGMSAWVSLGTLPADIVSEFFNGGATGELEFVAASTYALEVHIGTTGGDNIDYGGRSAVLVLALEGDDVVDMLGQPAPVVCYAGDGINVVYGGTYDDYLLGGDDSDEIYGSEGDDDIGGFGGDDYIEGGIGDDVIQGNEGYDEIYGDHPSDPTITGNDHIEGGDHPSTGTNWGDILFGGPGDDVIWGDVPGAYMSGTDGDYIEGNDGNDEIHGGCNGDEIHGGDGMDDIFGDESYSNAGDDVIYGGYGDDLLRGERGSDIIYGDDGNDALDGGAGLDYLYGGDGADFLYDRDNSAGDELYGQGGTDRFLTADWWGAPQPASWLDNLDGGGDTGNVGLCDFMDNTSAFIGGGVGLATGATNSFNFDFYATDPFLDWALNEYWVSTSTHGYHVGTRSP